ncbi:hypothetical protein H5085_10070 [Pseudoalteromonas sp. SR43-6]|uniref:hypothetical protein n=1 Tax=unclassified Pseudoalteromonas TaxID=194690 RepID=UPI0015FBC8BA|nr:MULTISPECIES: hypothetical protein [unclassified Pseudoalteromonas]MBB1288922.1 hypothetical protein [Pseudoalteromonas sp. SR41-5]MBB1374665.1 hypothetical protein [Pseudoalteromonas sp. SR43-6]MBB1413779.1 hypothetical protein [Pseudoalteromonas sp. SG43-8]
MKIPAFLVIFFFSMEISAEKFGNWEYFIPQNSPFSLNPIDNGLYLQFFGEVTFNAKIVATINENGDAYILAAIPPDEIIRLLPSRKIGNIQLPKYIQLLNNEEMLSSLNMIKYENAKNSKIILGSAEVTITSLQSGADCGVANFFAFNNSITNLEYYKSYEVVKSPSY